jgi:hypothetical protein
MQQQQQCSELQSLRVQLLGVMQQQLGQGQQ